MGVVDDRRACRRLDDDPLDAVGGLTGDGLDGRPEQLLRRVAVRRDVDRRDHARPGPGTPRRASRHEPHARGCRGSRPRGARTAAPPWPRPTRRPRSRSSAERTSGCPGNLPPQLPAAACAEWAAVIDLRSDTVTRPTPGMRAAIAAAVVGDEQMREDPTVNELQERVAELLGQERAHLPPDRDDGEPDRPEAARPARRRAPRRAALAHPDLRVRRRRRPRGPAHRRAPGCGGRLTRGPGTRGDVDRGGRRRPASRRARAREHAQRRRRPRVAARRDRRRRRRRPGRRASACTWTARG